MHDVKSPQVEGCTARWRKISASSRVRTAAGALAVGVLALTAGGMSLQTSALARSSLLQSTASTVDTVPSKQFNFADLVERVAPAVVSVQVVIDRQMQPTAMPEIPAPFRDFFRQFDNNPRANRRTTPAPRTFRGQAAGSGFIVDPTGYIVTNHHVVDSARKITVKLSDGREFQAKLVGSDKDTDVALLKIEGNNFPTVVLGDDRPLQVGDWVVAVGNPFGLGGTVTAGIVSSMGRDIGNGPYTDYIQIDAPINSGNSGGPTFDINGRVVGMNTAIFSPSGGSVGIGFAVPATTIQAVVDQLKMDGTVSRGWLGVQIQDLTPELAAGLDAKATKGALVAQVVANSPAQKAGFAQGDIIVALNGTNVEDTRALTREVAAMKAGQKAAFTVLRDGARHSLTATIEKRDPDRLAAADQTPPTQPSSLGMKLMPVTPAVREQYELDDNMTGVVVASVDPNSEADSKGLKPGDVIKRVGSRSVRQPTDVSHSIEDAKQAGRESVLALVGGEEGDRFVALRIAQG